MTPKTCPHCREGALHWDHDPHIGWQLYDKANALHACKDFSSDYEDYVPYNSNKDRSQT